MGTSSLRVGCEWGIHEMELLVADRWIERVLDVKCVCKRMMVVSVIVGRSMLNLISVYVPNTGRQMEEKRIYPLIKESCIRDR